jgi:signal transduction histidine kinase
VLREALIQYTGHAPLPAPRWLSGDLLLDRDHDSSLVRIQAHLTDISTEASDQILTLQAGAHGFVARLNILRGPHQDLLPGSRLELTGVYFAQGGDVTSAADIDSFELLLNSPADIVVLERPSWWTLQRLLVAFGLIAVVLVGAILWIFTLRRRVNAQTLVIHQKVEREATLEERARIARDIHDTLEQALAGTSFQLNALAGSLDNVPQEPLRILDVARSMVRHAQEEARRTVQNLRFLDLEKHDLPTALAQLAAQSGADSPIEILVNVRGTIQGLPSQVESHLLRISQEAITNAIKHSRVKIVRLELEYDAGWLQLTIHDDGCGFEVVHTVPTAAGHFGLLGMRERAEKIGGTLQIQSAPGRGTTIQVRVPLSQPTISKKPNTV